MSLSQRKQMNDRKFWIKTERLIDKLRYHAKVGYGTNKKERKRINRERDSLLSKVDSLMHMVYFGDEELCNSHSCNWIFDELGFGCQLFEQRDYQKAEKLFEGFLRGIELYLGNPKYIEYCLGE